jgi:hypothetical protein
MLRDKGSGICRCGGPSILALYNVTYLLRGSGGYRRNVSQVTLLKFLPWETLYLGRLDYGFSRQKRVVTVERSEFGIRVDICIKQLMGETWTVRHPSSPQEFFEKSGHEMVSAQCGSILVQVPADITYRPRSHSYIIVMRAMRDFEERKVGGR